MRNKLNAGNSNIFGIVVIVILAIAMVTSSRDGGTSVERNGGSGSNLVSNNSSKSSNTSQTEVKPTKQATISVGNAKSAYQTFQEYITITSRSREPINITNWILKNGKEDRPYYLGGSIQIFPSDTAFIPRGVRFISPTGHNVFQDIVLERGESVVITTGKMGSRTPYEIVSFKENICSGYLENMDEYNFTPPLTKSCPRPSNEAGLEALDTGCQTFIKRLPSCTTPDFTPKDKDGETCRNCVNNTPLSNACVAFIKSHFSYGGCIANHLNDPNFSGKRWRVFLGLGWEMWAKEYESIQLFNNLGQLVDKKTY